MSDFEFREENTIEAVFSMEVGREMNDHSKLYNRYADDQHPISAITGLTEALAGQTSDLQSEIGRAEAAEQALDNKIEAETTRAEGVESGLNTAIGNETTARIQADTTLQNNITAEESRAKGVENGLRSDLTAETTARENADNGLQTQITANANDIDNIEDLIPAEASPSNKLIDKSYVDTADSSLQSQIDAISASSDVTDIVGTYAELQAYDTSTLTNDDIIKVLQDESQGGATTYYRWVLSGSSGSFVLIGSEGPYYTKAEADELFNEKQDEITATNKLDSDLVDDNGQTNKFVTASEKAQITTNANNITDLQTNKADKSTTLEGYGITNAYTKTEVDTALNNKADKSTTYTKTDVDTIATGKANVGLDNLNADGKLVIGAEIGNRERKDISSLVSNGTLSQAVAEQNLEKYGIRIGDYFTGASGYTYTVADMDTFYGGYNNNAVVNTHHVCLVVDTKHNEPWNYSTTLTANNINFTYDSAGTGYYAWKNGNDYVYTSMRQPNPNSDKAYSDTALTTEYATITAVNNFTDGGYVASNLHSYLTGTALTNVQSDLGTSHLVKHGKIYSNAMTPNRYNRTGQNSGASSNWAWSLDQYISALTEAQMYGTIIWSSSGNDTGEAFKQLDLFRKFRANQIFGNTGIWLRDVVSSSSSASLNLGGFAAHNVTRINTRVVGLIMFY